MKKTKYVVSVLAAFLFAITFAAVAQGQTQRSYVAGPGTGSDANNVAPDFCSFVKPCRNFQTAYNVTNAGGEIVALHSVGYGGLSIGHAITVEAAPGQYAFVAVVPSSNGIAVSAGASDAVVLRNIQFAGAPALGAGSAGISHTGGRLVIENCAFFQLATGISVNNAKVDVISSDILSNTIGVSTTGSGADQQCGFDATNGQGQWPGDNTTQVRMEKGTLTNNGTGFVMNNPGVRHANCFCSAPCPFPTATTSILPTQNLITVFLHSTDNSSAGVVLNITGNTTFMSGTGAACTATPGNCTQPITYSGITNPR
jgi:hypothetical protein